MEGLFFILFVLPTIGVLSLLFAIIYGFTRSRNPKRYFIKLGCVVGLIAFLISTLFIDYESRIVNLFTWPNPPTAYQNYKRIEKTLSSDYTITELAGESIETVLEDSLTKNTIVITSRSNYDRFFHRIDSTGHLVGMLRDTIFQANRDNYLLTKDGFCDWIRTGDSTIQPYKPIHPVLNRQTLRSHYKEADFAYFFSDSLCVLQKQKSWYACKIDFRPLNYDNQEEYLDKTTKNSGRFVEKSVDNNGSQDNDSFNGFLTFKHCPETTHNETFLFEHFEKERYYSGFGSFLSGLGSPTGGGGHWAKWYGSAYCKLTIGKNQIPFTCQMIYQTEAFEGYEISMSIYSNPTFAIVSKPYWIHLITLKEKQ